MRLIYYFTAGVQEVGASSGRAAGEGCLGSGRPLPPPRQPGLAELARWERSALWPPSLLGCLPGCAADPCPPPTHTPAPTTPHHTPAPATHAHNPRTPRRMRPPPRRPLQVRCWQIREHTKAPQAAGAIHSDFERGFICAEIMAFEDMKEHGSEAGERISPERWTVGRGQGAAWQACGVSGVEACAAGLGVRVQD